MKKTVPIKETVTKWYRVVLCCQYIPGAGHILEFLDYLFLLCGSFIGNCLNIDIDITRQLISECAKDSTQLDLAFCNDISTEQIIIIKVTIGDSHQYIKDDITLWKFSQEPQIVGQSVVLEGNHILEYLP